MYVSFSRISGPYELDNRRPSKASTVIEVGDALEDDTGLAPAESDDEIFGICLEARASVANQTGFQYLVILDRAKFYGLAEAGTFVNTTDTFCDFNSADGLAADTNSNHDWQVCYVLSTTESVGKFTHISTSNRL